MYGIHSSELRRRQPLRPWTIGLALGLAAAVRLLAWARRRHGRRG